MDFFEFLANNIWIPIVAGCLIVALIGVIVWCCLRWRRKRHYDYSALEERISLPERWENERRRAAAASQESAFVTCQFYLRATADLSDPRQLPEIGSRLHKHWFLIKFRGEINLLSFQSPSSKSHVPFSAAAGRDLNQLVLSLQHPFVFPARRIEFSVDQNLVFTLQPYVKQGSLKDLIYGTDPTDEWGRKYALRGHSLKINYIQLFGRQILEALIWLNSKGLPPHSHLHSGNIILVNGVARVAAIENQFLGVTARAFDLVKRRLKGHSEWVEPMLFGHLLYEMAAGFELNKDMPYADHYAQLDKQPVADILQMIFSNPESCPTNQQITEHLFFRNVPLRELAAFNDRHAPLSTRAKDILRSVSSTEGRSEKRRKSQAPRKEPRDDAKPEMVSSSQPGQATATSAGAPPPPPPPPPPTPSYASGPNPMDPGNMNVQGERVALLGDIRRGSPLKKVSQTEIRDRSSPKV